MALIRSSGRAANKHYVIVTDISSIGKQWQASEIVNGVVTTFAGTPNNTTSITINDVTVTGSEGSGGTNDRLMHVTGVTGKIYIADTATTGSMYSAKLGATITDATAGATVEVQTTTHPATIVIEID